MQDGQVIIVDEFTGRVMPGRRWSDGLHQAIEAKENVKIERENQTLATITFQNYFRMYKKLAGMTGTAETEAAEFEKTYKLDVMVIPTNRIMVRKEFQDMVYRTEEEKFRNAAKEIQGLHEKGQPVLVGTISVEKSERLAALLKKMGVKHEVLNAKNHEREAFIIAQAGRKGAVTVSTNMAGRGTDILLGGNPEFLTKEYLKKQNKDPDLFQTSPAGSPERAEWDQVFARFREETAVEHDEVIALGGLHVLGTERHESRRIDNQLRGRAGRQGDPGSSRFYLSLQDDLMRIFGGERMQKLMLRLGMEEDVPIESQPDQQAHRRGPGSRGSAAFRLPQTPARIRRRDEQAAPGRVWHAPPVAGRHRSDRAHQRDYPGHRRPRLAMSAVLRRRTPPSTISPGCSPTC